MAKGDLGKLLNEERKKKILNANQFSKKINISSAHLSDIEKGNRLPSKELVEKIIKELGLKEKEEKIYDLLALESNNEKKIPVDVSQYIIRNKQVQNIIRIAKNKNLKSDFWKNIEEKINEI